MTVIEWLLKLIMANAVVNVKTFKSDIEEDKELRSTAFVFVIVWMSEGQTVVCSGAVLTNDRVRVERTMKTPLAIRRI
jgi:hypothetical protein